MGTRKLEDPVTLFAAIESGHYEALRALAFERRESIAGIVREALGLYLAAQAASRHREVGDDGTDESTRAGGGATTGGSRRGRATNEP